MEYLYSFSQNRPKPPSTAEQHLMTDYYRHTSKPSKLIPNKTITERQFYCPSCKKEINIDHGDRVKCDCGLIMENYGNSLVLWK